ncbi:S-layer homology domain-containing protein [Sporosarcina sp. SAFN-015]|uniref:S-layer homology domain-containing protein n=1 Tax=Sporosarcina sp. SAFN-015 TaxID=3387274 RepID=UPI003F8190D4
MKWKQILALLLAVVMILTLPPAATEAASPFKDVKPGHWAFESVDWAYSQKLTSGYPDGTFAPDKPITEAQLVMMLVRFDTTSPDAFPANKGEHKSSGNYRYLAGKHMPLEGVSRTFARDWAVKKGTAARIIAAFNGYDLSEAQAVYYLYSEDLATGRTGKNTFKDFSPNESLTRAEAVELLHRLSKTGSSDLIGLKKKASGSDNGSYPLPQNFKDDGTVYFPAPGGQTKPPVVFNPIETAEIDVEKSELIANGVDSTYVTVSFRGCNGETIPYDRSMSVRVTSSAGAALDGEYYYDQKSNNYYNRGRTSIISGTDGPDITVKVTAPPSKTYLNDTLTFEVLDRDAFGNTACLTKSVHVDLSYVPKAEVRLENAGTYDVYIGSENDGTPIYEKRTTIRATVALPGGEIVRNFNGKVHFRSTGGLRFSSDTVSFWNGVATTSVSAIQTAQPTRDIIIAEAIPSDSRYPNELIGVLNESHSIEVSHDARLRINPSCTAEMPEMAFIIDSSGSMKKNDRNRLRVSKTEELIGSLQASSNVATAFNSSAQYLEKGNWVRVQSQIYRVRENGGTNIGAGMTDAFNRMNSSGRKVAILLTDGKSSEKQIATALALAKSKDITVFTVGLGNEKNLNTALLKKIAADTGGSYYHISDSIDLGLVYQSILDEITCGVKLPTCSSASQIFVSPSVKITANDVFMETDIRETCGEIAKVIVRFESTKGYIDYELVHRGQNNYRFIRGINEMENIQYYKEAQFLAYDRDGKQIGAARTVNIVPR